MAIRKIRAKNFKSFKDLEVELGNLNILIGANASGKSNFVEIFKFLRDIQSSGLDNAISMQGGVQYLRNINIGSSEVFSLEVAYDQESRFSIEVEKRIIGIKVYEAVYKFAIRFSKKGLGFIIAEDKLTQKCDFIGLEKQKKEIEELGSGEIILSNVKGKVKADLIAPKEIPVKPDDTKFLKLPSKILLLETPLFSIPLSFSAFFSTSSIFSLSFPSESPFQSRGTFSDISIYDFDPKLSKKAVPITGKAELEKDGSNLSIVLKNIVGKRDEKRKLSNLVGDLLPFVADLGVEKFADRSLLFKLREIYSEKQYLPAPLISDGTINMIALIIALYFEKKPLTIIEEPGRNVHPYLISKVIDMMEDASENKQIIVTTHNPEMIRYADKKDILLISRNEEGFSTICRPSEKEDVKIFLEHGLRMERLYVDNFLEVE